MPLKFIDPIKEIGSLLLTVEKPSRYTGGEFGLLSKRENFNNKSFNTLIAFPDLYEIGMGNQALKIIYNNLNNMKGINCDRAFAPAPDFEKLLRAKNMPLYGLDSGVSLNSLDLLMFTLGYELGLGGILLMLDVSQIPLRCEDRNDGHPLVIIGGPAASNPLPYSPFVDAFWIGEAEAGFFELANELAEMKRAGEGGACKTALFEKLAEHPNVWTKTKKHKKARRAIVPDLSAEVSAVYPVPSMKIVQNHGAVEIMRGCPNGCRFCHAGFWYRPMRQKSLGKILKETKDFVTKGGWQQISLSSLSSGDYNGIGELVDILNREYKDRHVSFQLPSLKVSGFTLNLLEKISVTRKSGLTFAVETPLDAWQMAINKTVTRDSVVKILSEAKKRGWKGAKFYFMIGLPKPQGHDNICEEQEIVDFITDVARCVKMHFNINVGIFIPKPHTPYQRTVQLDRAQAARMLDFIRLKLKPLGHKVSVSDLLTARLEGIMSRGDERAGFLFEEAFIGGSRLDAWNEYIDKEKWEQLLDSNAELVSSVLSGSQCLWGEMDSCVTEEYLSKELEKSSKGESTGICSANCRSCGVCKENVRLLGSDIGVQKNKVVNLEDKQVNQMQKKGDPDIHRILFSFSKTHSGVFHGHLSLIEIFSMSFRRASIPVMYTQGFNPLAKMEFASPLSLGISAAAEIACVDFLEDLPAGIFLKDLNKTLPQGFCVERAEMFHIPQGKKKHSLSSLLWGFAYANKDGTDYINKTEEKAYRQNRLENNCQSLFDLKRTGVLAKDLISTDNYYASYFDVYNCLYH